MNIPTLPSTISPGRGLAIARAAWVAVTLLAVMLFVVELPMFYEDPSGLTYSGDEYGEVSTYDVGDRNEASYANLAQLGLSAEFYAGYNIALSVAFAAACLALATLIFVRKSDEPIALFVALTLVLLGTGFWGPATEPEGLHPALSELIKFLASLFDTCVLNQLRN